MGRIHEQLEAPYEEKVLSGKLYHRTYENWEQYFRKFNQYTSLLAQQYVEQKKRSVLCPIFYFGRFGRLSKYI